MTKISAVSGSWVRMAAFGLGAWLLATIRGSGLEDVIAFGLQF